MQMRDGRCIFPLDEPGNVPCERASRAGPEVWVHVKERMI